jgi:hypothetical protein
MISNALLLQTNYHYLFCASFPLLSLSLSFIRALHNNNNIKFFISKAAKELQRSVLSISFRCLFAQHNTRIYAFFLQLPAPLCPFVAFRDYIVSEERRILMETAVVVAFHYGKLTHFGFITSILTADDAVWKGLLLCASLKYF